MRCSCGTYLQLNEFVHKDNNLKFTYECENEDCEDKQEETYTRFPRLNGSPEEIRASYFRHVVEIPKLLENDNATS